MKWNNRWPAYNDLRRVPTLDPARIESRIGNLVPPAALILTPDQAKLFRIKKEDQATVSVRVVLNVEDAEIDQELFAAEEELQVAIQDSDEDPEVVPDEEAKVRRVEKLEAVKRAAKRAERARQRRMEKQRNPPTSKETEIRALPKGARGWVLDAPVFVMDITEVIER